VPGNLNPSRRGAWSELSYALRTTEDSSITYVR